ncbi:hypothetical protein DPMN_063513 [Dreissena polymorpha]|uniref:Uncharacterized protein n=1 Tax=Dreissena polymorpha TaxID=45954 RepID=A0A9D4CBU5_DREPO|nr:hypothetical protein DPMN_063513 [Dreissena polymorpha]
MFNTIGMNRESPGRTGNNRGSTWNNRDGTVAPTRPIRLRQRPGCRRWSPDECPHSPSIATVHR